MKLANLGKIGALIIIVVALGMFEFHYSQPKAENPIKLDKEPLKEEPADKVVYLTFDADMTPHMKEELKDGKVKEWYDPQLITYLETEHIPATIFVTGMFGEVYPTVVKEWGQNKLFTIGNHSYSHPGFTAHCYTLAVLSGEKAKKEEVERTQTILNGLIGYYPKFFRFPGLCHDKSDDQLIANLGLQVVDTDIISGDAFNKSSEAIVKKILKNLKNQKKTIILMHTGGPNAPSTAAAMKALIPHLQKQGYSFAQM